MDESEYRLSFDVDINTPVLHRWLEWSQRNVTPETIQMLHTAASQHGAEGRSTWWVYFGVIGAKQIVECVSMRSGEIVENWSEISPPHLDVKPIPSWRRHEWQKRMLKNARAGLERATGR